MSTKHLNYIKRFCKILLDKINHVLSKLQYNTHNVINVKIYNLDKPFTIYLDYIAYVKLTMIVFRFLKLRLWQQIQQQTQLHKQLIQALWE